MIKLPIRARIHADMARGSLSATVDRRDWLEEAAVTAKPSICGPSRSIRRALRTLSPRWRTCDASSRRSARFHRRMSRVATGDQRELDGVDLTDPTMPVRHVITVDALKEGWDCPSAYVLCATQNLSSKTAVEQILGRILRMPYAARRKTSQRLNEAYAEIVEGDFTATATALRDKLLVDGLHRRGGGHRHRRPTRRSPTRQGNLIDPRPDPRGRSSRWILPEALPAARRGRGSDEGRCDDPANAESGSSSQWPAR